MMSYVLFVFYPYCDAWMHHHRPEREREREGLWHRIQIMTEAVTDQGQQSDSGLSFYSVNRRLPLLFISLSLSPSLQNIILF